MGQVAKELLGRTEARHKFSHIAVSITFGETAAIGSCEQGNVRIAGMVVAQKVLKVYLARGRPQKVAPRHDLGYAYMLVVDGDRSWQANTPSLRWIKKSPQSAARHSDTVPYVRSLNVMIPAGSASSGTFRRRAGALSARRLATSPASRLRQVPGYRGVPSLAWGRWRRNSARVQKHGYTKSWFARARNGVAVVVVQPVALIVGALVPIKTKPPQIGDKLFIEFVSCGSAFRPNLQYAAPCVRFGCVHDSQATSAEYRFKGCILPDGEGAKRPTTGWAAACAVPALVCWRYCSRGKSIARRRTSESRTGGCALKGLRAKAA